MHLTRNNRSKMKKLVAAFQGTETTNPVTITAAALVDRSVDPNN